MQTYDASLVDVIAGSRRLDGFGAGTFITISRANPRFNQAVSADGTHVRSRQRNRMHTLAITVMATSQANQVLQNLANLDSEGPGAPFKIKVQDRSSGGGLVSDPNAYINEDPDITYANDVQENTWTLVLPDPVISRTGAAPTFDTRL